MYYYFNSTSCNCCSPVTVVGLTVGDLEDVTSIGCKKVHTPPSPSSHDGSIKSGKNMGDFEGEFTSEDELMKIEEFKRFKGPHSPKSPTSPSSMCK